MDTAGEGHYRRIRRVLIWILALNWAVALAKIIYGLYSRCSSMTADGFHSLSDGASNIVGIIGIHFACQPKDADHPYGHKKYETFFSLLIAFLLFALSFNLLKEGLLRLRNIVIPRIDGASFLVMIITLGINLWVMRYEYKKGLQLKSDILISDALHTKADIFTSLSVIVTLIAVKSGLHLLDPIATIIISLFVAHAGYDIVKDSSAVLCDTAAILDPLPRPARRYPYRPARAGQRRYARGYRPHGILRDRRGNQTGHSGSDGCRGAHRTEGKR